MQRPLKLSLKTQHYLKKASWSQWLQVFNQVHNSTLVTKVGTVKVKIYEEEDSNTKKSQKSD